MTIFEKLETDFDAEFRPAKRVVPIIFPPCVMPQQLPAPVGREDFTKEAEASGV